uniref:Uncharacterized protein n=1 Tax=Anguilla anguilla TaxID=7936 RepID=A0A0E9SYE2_ANGAN
MGTYSKFGGLGVVDGYRGGSHTSVGHQDLPYGVVLQVGGCVGRAVQMAQPLELQ